MSRFSNLEFDPGEANKSTRRPEAKGVGDYISEANQAFSTGRFEQALRLYSKVLEFDPAHAEAWVGQVRMLIEMGELREAALWVDKGLELVPEEADLLAAKASVLARSGDSETALAFSDAAIEKSGEGYYVWLARADVLTARNEKLADSCFSRAFALAPNRWFVMWLASRIRLFYQHFSAALKLAQQALEVNATEAVLWMQLGRCQLTLGFVSGARYSMEQARQLDPEFEGSRDGLTRARSAGWRDRVKGWVRRWAER